MADEHKHDWRFYAIGENLMEFRCQCGKSEYRDRHSISYKDVEEIKKKLEAFELMVKSFVKEGNRDIFENNEFAERSRGENLAYKTIMNSNGFKDLKEAIEKVLKNV